MLLQEINNICFSRKKNLINKNNNKQEVDWFVTWSLNYALPFLDNKNYKASFDMLRVVKYGVPIVYIF